MKRPLCQFCGQLVSAAYAAKVQRYGKAPRFCELPNHAWLGGRRRRNLIAKGFEGEALEREMARLAKAYKPRAPKVRAEVIGDHVVFVGEMALESSLCISQGPQEQTPAPEPARASEATQSPRDGLLDELDAIIAGLG